MLVSRRAVRLCSVQEGVAVEVIPLTPPTVCAEFVKEIWKASVRSVRVPSLWSSYAKQVTAQSSLLSARDVATVLHSFARVKYRDEKTLASIIPSILKNIDTFSVREIVHIMSAFRKLEYPRLDCVDLLVNQLVIRSSEWNAVDTALIANSLAYFRVFDESVWKKIEKHITKNTAEYGFLGAGLVVGAMAKLDIRNERVLRAVARAVGKGTLTKESVKQESLAVLLHGFYKLGWTKDFHLNEFFDQQLETLVPLAYFDNQSLCMVLHALVCYRALPAATGQNEGLDSLGRIFTLAVQQLSSEWKPNLDQLRRLDAVATIAPTLLHSATGVDDGTARALKDLTRIVQSNSATAKEAKSDELRERGHKLPRWEYEVYRMLKDRMEVPVRKKVRNGRTDILMKAVGGGSDVYVLCLGPFQYYANSTKRTRASLLNKALITAKGKGAKVMEIPYFVWNELKTDQDKIMYLYSQGRQVLQANKNGENLEQHLEEMADGDAGHASDTCSGLRGDESRDPDLIQAFRQ